MKRRVCQLKLRNRRGVSLIPSLSFLAFILLNPHVLPASGEDDGGAGTPGDAHEQTNVIVISVDTLRQDHLGCYGYGRKTSEHIDGLADHRLSARVG